MKVLEIFQSYAQMTMRQFQQLPAAKSMDETLARKWFQAAYIYSEERLLENATPQSATSKLRTLVSCNDKFLNEIAIAGELMYQKRVA